MRGVSVGVGPDAPQSTQSIGVTAVPRTESIGVNTTRTETASIGVCTSMDVSDDFTSAYDDPNSNLLELLYDKVRECAICTLDQPGSNFVYQNKCSHSFCESCVTRSESMVCMMCRVESTHYVRLVKDGSRYMFDLWESENARPDPLEALYNSRRVCSMCFAERHEYEFVYRDACTHKFCKMCMLNSSLQCIVCQKDSIYFTHLVKIDSRYTIDIWQPDQFVARASRVIFEETNRYIASSMASTVNFRDVY